MDQYELSRLVILEYSYDNVVFSSQQRTGMHMMMQYGMMFGEMGHDRVV